MTKINWPDDNKPAVFSDLADAVRNALKHCYKIKRRNHSKDFDWKGPDLPKCMGATCVNFDETLKAEYLKYQTQDKGNSAIDIIIAIAVQLGIEQGRRMYREEINYYITNIKFSSDQITEQILRLKSYV